MSDHPAVSVWIGRLCALVLLTLSPIMTRAKAEPATDPILAGGSTLRDADLRVAEIGYRIARQGRALCADPLPLTGLLLHHLAEYAPADRSEAIKRFGLDRGPGILTVLAGSPAARAGLIAGDVLLSIDGVAPRSPMVIADERDRRRQREMMNESDVQLETRLRSGASPITLLRDGRTLTLTLDSEPGCAGRVRLARSKQTNAFATGDTVVLTTAMLDYLKSDDELAVVVAHEMAHNILGHPATLDELGVPRRGVLRGIGANAARIWQTEEEADRLGIKLAAAAGFDVGAAIPFWRRYYADYDLPLQLFRTHPSLRARERIARETIAALDEPARD